MSFLFIFTIFHKFPSLLINFFEGMMSRLNLVSNSVLDSNRSETTHQTLATQTDSPVRRGVSIHTQTDLARSPVVEISSSSSSDSSSLPPVNSSDLHNFALMPGQIPLVEIYRHEMCTSAVIVNIKVTFKWPDTVPHELVAGNLIKVLILMATIDDKGCFKQAILPLRLLDCIVNNAIIKPSNNGI